jgi:hypothetical protein
MQCGKIMCLVGVPRVSSFLLLLLAGSLVFVTLTGRGLSLCFKNLEGGFPTPRPPPKSGIKNINGPFVAPTPFTLCLKSRNQRHSLSNRGRGYVCIIGLNALYNRGQTSRSKFTLLLRLRSVLLLSWALSGVDGCFVG